LHGVFIQDFGGISEESLNSLLNVDKGEELTILKELQSWKFETVVSVWVRLEKICPRVSVTIAAYKQREILEREPKYKGGGERRISAEKGPNRDEQKE